MSSNQMSMFDSPAGKRSNQDIERVYVTRGKNTYNSAGQICDRVTAISIGGKLHWINTTFATYSELSRIYRPLGITVNYLGEYAIKKEGSNELAQFSKKVTKIRGSETEIFSEDSRYMERSQRCKGESIWWTVEEIKQTYFSETA